MFDLRYDGLAKMFNVSERGQFDKGIIQRIQEHPRLSDSSSQLLTEDKNDCRETDSAPGI